MLWAAYFFLSEEKVVHTQDVHTIVDVISSVGGLMSIILGIANSAMLMIGRKSITAKLIRSLFFKEVPNINDLEKHTCEVNKATHSIKFGFWAKYVAVKVHAYRILKCCKLKPKFSESEKLFIHGEEEVFKELNIFNMI